jgi:hypothetical protein
MPVSTVRLFVENARNIPTDIHGAKLLEQYGLFGGASNNMNTFNPDINVNSDVVPKEEDFIRVPFRLLSSTVVATYSWRATDFGDELVLKKSMKKLIGKPVYIDHDTESVVNNVGVIESVKWTAAKKGENGEVIPAGIDGILKIDAKANPKVARGVLSSPPSIGSFSVTVSFDWEPSHKFSDPYLFENALGTIVDDKMVARKATVIHDYFEGSLVWLGADPYAKILDTEGKPLQIDRSSVFQNSKNEKESALYAEKGLYIAQYSFRSAESLQLHLSENDMKMTLAQFLAKLGLEKFEGLEIEGLHIMDAAAFGKLPTAEQLAAVNTQLTDSKAAVTSLTAELATANESVTSLGAEIVTLKAENANFKVGSENFAQVVTKLREDTKKQYGIFSKGKPSATIQAMLEKASYEELEALIVEYGGKVNENFSAKCSKCGCTELSYGSSQQAGNLTDIPKNKVPFADQRRKQQSMNIGK